MGKKATTAVKKEKAPRTYTRFKPDPLTTAVFVPDINGKVSLVTLVLNESLTGCALLAHIDQKLKKGQKVVVKVGNLHEMTSEVIWATEIDENIYKIGLKYLE